MRSTCLVVMSIILGTLASASADPTAKEIRAAEQRCLKSPKKKAVGADCLLVSDAYREGFEGQPDDRPKAIEFSVYACNASNSDGCEQAALYLRTDDPQRYSAMLTMSCKLGSGSACDQLGHDHHDRGELKEAAAAWDKGCKFHNELACTNMGDLLQRGSGVRKDEKRAYKLFLFSCDNGDSLGCTKLAEMHLTGKGAPKDRKAGAAMVARACEQGYQKVCELLHKK